MPRSIWGGGGRVERRGDMGSCTAALLPERVPQYPMRGPPRPVWTSSGRMGRGEYLSTGNRILGYPSCSVVTILTELPDCIHYLARPWNKISFGRMWFRQTPFITKHRLTHTTMPASVQQSASSRVRTELASFLLTVRSICTCCPWANWCSCDWGKSPDSAEEHCQTSVFFASLHSVLPVEFWCTDVSWPSKAVRLNFRFVTTLKFRQLLPFY